jgi:formimidoylglutamate deiminase
MTVLAADWTWDGARFVSGVRVAIDAQGDIEAVGPEAGAGRPVTALAGRALLPGFVNAHSHAFQRGLRGRGERFPAGAGSFWTWREAMYALVDALTEDELRRLASQAFREMLAAGITTVGEFHYVHHGSADWSLDRALIEAAADTGIRLVLLQVYYRTGGIGRPLEPAQRRFDGRSPEVFWRRMDELQGELDPARCTLGCAPHSIRAVPIDELAELFAEARRRELVVHAHVEETRREIEECVAATGRRPLELLLERLDLDEGFTAVHGTHTTADDLARLAERGATLCLCPTTEGNLGDGLPRLAPGLTAPVALGSDSNARISMLEEMRWAEYGQRLVHEARGVLTEAGGVLGRRLLGMATEGGARALGVAAGRIAPGHRADLVEIDLGAAELDGWTPETLPEALALGAGERVIAGVRVGGRRPPR